MEVIRETLWKRRLSTPTKPPAKNSNIFASRRQRTSTKERRRSAIKQIKPPQFSESGSLMDKPHRKPWPKSKTSDICKQSPSPLHHTFLLGRARFTAQPLSALGKSFNTRYNYVWLWRCWESGATRWPCWRSESFEMFYLRELLNCYPSMEIYVRRPRLYPFRHPFLLKRVKNEASCPISLKEGRGWAQVGRYPAVFC